MARAAAANRYLEVVTTTARYSDARRIARTLVEKRLAACVQIVGPIQSIYHWQGRVETAAEWLCLVKTTRARYPQLAALIRRIHPYTTPQLIALPVVNGSSDYLAWLAAAVSPARRTPAT
uniref:Divalent-cation tolerance protein CutA n=1 Tax=candidate division WOR-3 bacterium TaxID=2052148 RepID=A0A7C4GB98_UNCW3